MQQVTNILFPRFAHPAVEERYASWHAELLLGRLAPGAEWLCYDAAEDISSVAKALLPGLCIVVTDPLLVVQPRLLESLVPALEASGAVAAVPVSNEAAHPEQRTAPAQPYLTLRQFTEVAEQMGHATGEPWVMTEWSGDPGLFVCSLGFLESRRGPAARALDGETVAVAKNAYVHRWASFRGQLRLDLLARIPESARNILEFGCGEAVLGAAVKERQRCRYVGIELDRDAAAVARRRIDDVYVGDTTELVGIIHERFDWIIGGDILEHLSDPWSFLIDLRHRSEPGGALLLSIPNIANWAMIADLLRGRFDYSYIAIACAGHLRFFTRSTITDALEIAGWTVESIEAQEPIVNPEFERLIGGLIAAGIPFSADDITTTGFYVIARNPSG